MEIEYLGRAWLQPSLTYLVVSTLPNRISGELLLNLERHKKYCA